MNNANGTPELPLGLGVALVQNATALKAFGSLTIPEQQEFIENAHTIRNSEEMRAYVCSLVEKGGTK